MLGVVDELSEYASMQEIPFKVGDSVKVIEGIFKDFSGQIEKINEDKRSLEISVLILGKKTPTELNYTQVEKIS